MKNPLKKSKTTGKSKVVVGGKKKAPRSKWKIAYLSLAGLLIFTTIGYSGYSYTKVSSLKAHASSYTFLTNYWGVSASACKTYIAAYGGWYQVKFLYNKTTSAPSYFYRNIVYRRTNNSQIVGDTGGSNAYWMGVVAGTSVTASAWADSIAVRINGSQVGPYIGGQYGDKPWNQIANC